VFAGKAEPPFCCANCWLECARQNAQQLMHCIWLVHVHLHVAGTCACVPFRASSGWSRVLAFLSEAALALYLFVSTLGLVCCLQTYKRGDAGIKVVTDTLPGDRWHG
jgi:hypothetical protein